MIVCEDTWEEMGKKRTLYPYTTKQITNFIQSPNRYENWSIYVLDYWRGMNIHEHELFWRDFLLSINGELFFER